MTPNEQVWMDYIKEHDCMEAPFERGARYYFTTGRYDIVGTVRAATPYHLILDDCERIFDSGSLVDFFKSKKATTSEALPDGHIVATSWVLEASPL